ncbi:MAG: hypothetical protein J6Y02_21685 [Pseudobutyrivibrio sp.]|nr:hypothetical protein [Pseudobutyrivibrio sp.]
MKKYLLVIENERFASDTESILFYARLKFKKTGITKYTVWMDEDKKEELMDKYDFMAFIECDTKARA